MSALLRRESFRTAPRPAQLRALQLLLPHVGFAKEALSVLVFFDAEAIEVTKSAGVGIKATEQVESSVSVPITSGSEARRVVADGKAAGGLGGVEWAAKLRGLLRALTALAAGPWPCCTTG